MSTSQHKRQYTPQSSTNRQLRVASFNMQRTRCCQDIVTLTTNVNADFITFQEPPHAAVTPAPNANTSTHTAFISELTSYCSSKHYTPYITNNSIVLVKSTLHVCLKQHPPALHAGRAQFFLYKLSKNEFLLICSIYNYQTGHRNSDDVITLKNSIHKQLSSYKDKYTNLHIIIAGDINISTTTQKYSPTNGNLLKYFVEQQKLTSLLPKFLNNSKTNICTRYEAARGFATSPDHILCNSLVLPNTYNPLIDTDCSYTTIPSDHFLIACDFEFPSCSPPTSSTANMNKPKYAYSKICSIPIQPTDQWEQPSHIPPLDKQKDRFTHSVDITSGDWFVPTQHRLTSTTYHNNVNIITSLLHKHNNHPVVRDHFLQLVNTLNQLELSVKHSHEQLHQQSSSTTHSPPDSIPKLISRTKQHKDLINRAMTLLMDGINLLLDAAGYCHHPNKKRKLTSHTQPSKRRRRNAVPPTPLQSTHPSHTDTPAIPPFDDISTTVTFPKIKTHLLQLINHCLTLTGTLHSTLTENTIPSSIQRQSRRSRFPTIATLLPKITTLLTNITDVSTTYSNLHSATLSELRSTELAASAKQQPILCPRSYTPNTNNISTNDTVDHIPPFVHNQLCTLDPHYNVHRASKGISTVCTNITQMWNTFSTSISSTSPPSTPSSTDAIALKNLLTTLRGHVFQLDLHLQTAYTDHNTTLNLLGRATKQTLPKHKDTPAPELYLKTHHTPGLTATLTPALTLESQLHATLHNHSEHMANPPGTNCFFATPKKDAAGLCGINTNFQKTFTRNNINKFFHLPKGSKLDKHLCDFVINAHETIKPLLQPKPPHPALAWPFVYKLHTEDPYHYSFSDFAASLRPSPDASRHGNFHLNILTRLHRDWAIQAHRLINLCLICRILPIEGKCMSRVPIPKPGTTDRRPISLQHSFEAHLSTLVATHLTNGIESINALPSHIYAYRKSKSCTDITLSHVAVLEDLKQYLHPHLAQLDEDFEKYFDRITHEMQCLALMRHHCPATGYVEFISDCFQDNRVDIITNLGTVLSTFPCGVKQGSPLACIIANLIAHMYTEVWTTPPPTQPSVNFAYKFHSPCTNTPTSKSPVIPHIVTSYCDDGSRYLSATSMPELITAIQHYTNAVGAFSIVTRIGRNATKSTIRLYNTPVGYEPPPIHSIAWSFAHRFIHEADLTVVYLPFLLPSHTIPSSYPSLPAPHRSLGTYIGLDGDLTNNSARLYKKLHKRLFALRDLPTHPLTDATLKHSLLASVATFNPLCVQLTAAQTTEIDTRIRFLASHKYKVPDKSLHPVLLLSHKKLLGYNQPSIHCTQLKGLIRELTVLLNTPPSSTPTPTSTHLRARLHSSADDIHHVHDNFIRDAMTTLASHGFFLRPLTDLLLSSLLDQNTITMNSLGLQLSSSNTDHKHFDQLPDANPTSLEKSLYTYSYSRLFTALLDYLRTPTNAFIGDINEDELTTVYNNVPFTVTRPTLKSSLIYINETIHNLRQALNAQLSFYTWSPPTTASTSKSFLSSFRTQQHWTLQSPFPYLHTNPQSRRGLDYDPNANVRNFLQYTTDDALSASAPSFCTTRPTPSLHTFPDYFSKARTSCSPLIFASDGGSKPAESLYVASTVITTIPADISLSQALSKQCIPLFARAQFVPSTIGTHTTSINTAEATALLHSLLLRPPQYPSLFIIDNLPLFAFCQKLLDSTTPPDPRTLIRDLYPTLGLTTALLLHQHLLQLQTETLPEPQSHPYAAHQQLLHNLTSLLVADHLHCLNPIIGVFLYYLPSHQLTNNGSVPSKPTTSTTTAPTEPSSPLFFLDYANFLADRICTNMLGSKTSSSIPSSYTQLQLVSHPYIPSLLFSFSYKNKLITTSHTDELHNAHQQHLLTQLSSHPSHGWIGRHLPDIVDPLGLLHINSPVHRILLHLASSHTEWLKYNSTYKKLHLNDIQSITATITDPTDIKHAHRACPFCSSTRPNPTTTHRIYPQPLQPEGTNLHLHTQCTNAILCECRNFFADKLNEHLSSLLILTSCIHNLVSPTSPHFDLHVPFHHLIGQLLRTWDEQTAASSSSPNTNHRPSTDHQQSPYPPLRLFQHLQPFLTAHTKLVPPHSPRQRIMPPTSSLCTDSLPSHPQSTAYLAQDAALLPTPPLTALNVSRKHHSLLDLSYTGILPQPLHDAVHAHITHHLTILRSCLTTEPDPPQPSQSSISPALSSPPPPSTSNVPSAPPPSLQLTSSHLLQATSKHRQFNLANDSEYKRAITTPNNTPVLLHIFRYHWNSIQSILVQRANCLQHVISTLLRTRLQSLQLSQPTPMTSPTTPPPSPVPSVPTTIISQRQLTMTALSTSPTTSTTTAPLTLSLSSLSPRPPQRLQCTHARCQLAPLVNELPNTHLPSYSSCHACAKHNKLLDCTGFLEQSLLTYPTVRKALAHLLQPHILYHHVLTPTPTIPPPSESPVDLLYQVLNQYRGQTLTPLASTCKLSNTIIIPSCPHSQTTTLAITLNLLLNTLLLPSLHTYTYDPPSPTTAHLLGTLHTIFQPCTCSQPSSSTTPLTPCLHCHHFNWPCTPQPLHPTTLTPCCILCSEPSLFPNTHTITPPLCTSCYLYCLLRLRPLRYRWNSHLYNVSSHLTNASLHSELGPRTPLISVPSLTNSNAPTIPTTILLDAPPAQLTTRHLTPSAIRAFKNSIIGTTPFTPTTYPLPLTLSDTLRPRYTRGLLIANLLDDPALLSKILLPIPHNITLHHTHFLHKIITTVFHRLQPLTPSLQLRLHPCHNTPTHPIPSLLPTIPPTTSALLFHPMSIDDSLHPPHIVFLHHSPDDASPTIHTIVQPLNSSAHTLLNYEQHPQLFAKHHPKLYHQLCHQHSLSPTLSQHPTHHTITILPALSSQSLPTTPTAYLLATLYLYMTYPIQPPPPSWNTHINMRPEHSLRTLLQHLLIYLIRTTSTPQLWTLSTNTTPH